ncbi:MAG: putative nucleic-acid-binding protein containing a Zn-ribbon [Pseudomonadota bacterium]|jgi:uncharacterized OB-fold protein
MSAAAPVAVLRCADCGRIDSPGRVVCAGCLSTRLEPSSVAGSGRLATWTTIRRAPTRFREDAPYDVAVVDLDAGLRVTGRLVPGAPPAVGAPVHALAGDGPYIRFELRDAAPATAPDRGPR